MVESSGEPDSDLLALASQVDQFARHQSHYRIYASSREALGLSMADGDEAVESLPLRRRAVAIAFDYRVEVADGNGRPKIRVVSKFQGPQGSIPPPISALDEEIVSVWRSLVGLVKAPAALARFHHLLWERRDGNASEHARSAVDAYCSAAGCQQRHLDAVDDLSAALRLARSVGDADRARRCVCQLLDVVQRALDDRTGSFGARLRALEIAVGDRDCPDLADHLLRRCVDASAEAGQRVRLLELQWKRASTDARRREVRRKQVEAWMEEAEAADSPLLRSIRLQHALQQAERSDDPRLRERVAAAMQDLVGQDLGLLRTSAASHRFLEEFERLRDGVCKGETWEEALVTFASLPPLSGDTDQNGQVVRDQHALAPLSALMPTQLLSPEGLPLYSGTSEEDRFDVDLRRWESQLINSWAPIVADGLAEIPRRHGLPRLSDVGDLIARCAGMEGLPSDHPLVQVVASALLRYWSGDPSGSLYLALPHVEAVARHLVLKSGRGVFRLQRDHVPGQFPALGALLPITADVYVLGESRRRFYETLLVHPAGLNLRNVALHGHVGNVRSGYAAVVLHALLHLAMLPEPESAEDVQERGESPS